MQFLRKMLLVLVAAALPFLLFATAFDFGIYNVVGKPKPVKKILSDSGIYGSVVSQALNQAKTTSNGTSQVSLLDPEIKKAAEESFNPQVVQTSSEKVIDGIYDWLGGKSAQPDISVDLSKRYMPATGCYALASRRPSQGCNLEGPGVFAAPNHYC
jgi:hypothetical protein